MLTGQGATRPKSDDSRAKSGSVELGKRCFGHQSDYMQPCTRESCCCIFRIFCRFSALGGFGDLAFELSDSGIPLSSMRLLKRKERTNEACYGSKMYALGSNDS